MKKYSLLITVLTLAIVLIISFTISAKAQQDGSFALINGLLIDGTGAKPIEHSVVIIRDGKITDVGIMGQITIPENIKIIELNGSSVLPGFINAHVHSGFNPDNLKTWAANGVTSVRDLEIHIKSINDINHTLSMRYGELNKPDYARLFSAGPMITVPGGYGYVEITSPEEAENVVKTLINTDVDAIKISLEDGYDGKHNLPKLTPEEIKAIVETAHSYGKRVTLHVTQSKYLEEGVNLGVDEIAHVPYDSIPLPVIKTMVEKNIYLVPTFTIFRNYGAPIKNCISNLHNFVNAGGNVVLGNDFEGGIGTFETGIPMYEIECMQKAGMSAMDIIVSSTKNAAYVCGKAENLGTVEIGKYSDLLIIGGNPLDDINALLKIQMVLKNGEIIVNNMQKE